jgi:hypothetical protein
VNSRWGLRGTEVGTQSPIHVCFLNHHQHLFELMFQIDCVGKYC